MTAGALSNLFDRVKRGYVVDYFSFQFGWLKRWYSISADICGLSGTFLLAVSSFSPGPRAGGRKSDHRADKADGAVEQ